MSCHPGSDDCMLGGRVDSSYTSPGSTISTLLHDKINPKDCQVLSLGDSRFLQFFRVVSSDYGKPRSPLSTNSDWGYKNRP